MEYVSAKSSCWVRGWRCAANGHPPWGSVSNSLYNWTLARGGCGTELADSGLVGASKPFDLVFGEAAIVFGGLFGLLLMNHNLAPSTDY